MFGTVLGYMKQIQCIMDVISNTLSDQPRVLSHGRQTVCQVPAWNANSRGGGQDTRTIQL